jgi:alpha-soluble NSF attachment protein
MPSRYDAALEIYESIAKTSMESNLLKFNAKNHLLNAGICALATKDLVLVQMKWNDFQDIDYTFAESREGKFLQAMIQSFESYNPEAFADAVYQFDTISKIEPWKVTVLLRVKESIVGETDVAQDLT